MTDLIISDRDLACLRRLGCSTLHEELDRADIVAAHELPRNIVTIHSRVRYVDETTGERRRVTLVYPDHADVARGRVSVLAPVGAALLGLAAGDVITWNFPQGTRRLRVERVIQPRGRRRATHATTRGGAVEFPHPEHALVQEIKCKSAEAAGRAAREMGSWARQHAAGELQVHAREEALMLYATTEPILRAATAHAATALPDALVAGPVRVRVHAQARRVPYMLVHVSCPREFAGAVQRDLTARGAETPVILLGGKNVQVAAVAPLHALLGYDRWLSRSTQSTARMTMRLTEWRAVEDDDPGPHAA